MKRIEEFFSPMPCLHSTVFSPLGMDFAEDIFQRVFPSLAPMNSLLNEFFDGMIKNIGLMMCIDIHTLLEKFF